MDIAGWKRRTAGLMMMAALAFTAPAAADTLPEAVAAAYAANPRVAAARAQVRQVDEGVVQASAAARPTIGAAGGYTQDLTSNFGDAGRALSAGATLDQSIWEGGRIRANVSAATARVEAARASLDAIEQEVLVQTVTAYADVLRQREILQLNENQVRVLEQELRASQDRFEVGDVTRTDVAQSEARLAAALSSRDNARGQLTVIEQNYQILVGHTPAELAPLPPLPPMPDSADSARATALAANPDLLAARLSERASGHDVSFVRRQRAPSVSTQFGASYTDVRNPGGIGNRSGFNPQIGVSLSMPLFTGGLLGSQVRQAQARQSEQLEVIELTERQVAAAATGNWAQLQAAGSMIQSAQTQVSANELAAEGVRQENMVGSRDILDVLNAEQELLNSRVQLATARRDQYVLAYQLLAAMGAADVALEGAPVGRYDPADNYRRVRAKAWSEFSADGRPADNRDANRAPLMGPQ